ncbi:MAG: hypothetical protein D4R65_08130 [Verrucomicrobiaceae bacterium]|nr:MAG: hypothetical protein D4R65_08130 [Verrucomicrobiaceae bacterium]
MLPRLLFAAISLSACASLQAVAYPALNLMMQAESDFSTQTAGEFAQANPANLLFRAYGPASSAAAQISDITAFVSGLGTNWSGSLWFTPDATRADYADWSTYGHSTADSYMAYVDYLFDINSALTTAGLKNFSGIFLETEGSYMSKNATTLGKTGWVHDYLVSKSLGSVQIGSTGAWTTAGNLSAIGLDLLAIQVYNLDAHESSLNYNDASPQGAQNLASGIADILKNQYSSALGDLTAPGLNLMFSYETTFFGQPQWTAENFDAFLSDFNLAIPGASLGIYSSTDAFATWNAVGVPEPGALSLFALGALCVLPLVARARRSRL